MLTLAPEWAAIPVSPASAARDVGDATKTLVGKPRVNGSVSGLSPADRQTARQMSVAAAFLVLAHASADHYTQDLVLRWEGIAQDDRAWKGAWPAYSDCSSFVTWCLWQGLWHFHEPDLVNGEQWRAGYTGTMLTHGKPVEHEADWLPADAFLYREPAHTALYIGDGKVISHGGDPGPLLLPYNYRTDILEVRRYI